MIQEMEVIVSDVVRETEDSTTLFLFTGQESPEYQAGQFLTVDPHQFPALERWCSYLELLKGKKEPPRAYSMSSAPNEKYVSFTVKEDVYYPGETKYPPLLSPLLTFRTPVGTKMKIKGYTGSYIVDEAVQNGCDHILHLCAGSGIVPNYSIIKDELNNGSDKKHTLIFTNKTWNDIIFRDSLNELAADYPDKFKIIHTITREENSKLESRGVHFGRPDIDLIKSQIDDIDSTVAFVCGPAITGIEKKKAKEAGVEPTPRFVNTMLEYVEKIGIPSDRVKKESW
ncbi:MAG: oxidoreductase [Candidatus Marinimicrobia bacterium]|nr:oxidoreductase [Candidatus Neomarinimicrobiota bacterium]